MADFCLQCYQHLFDKTGISAKNDFIGFSTEEDTKNGLYVRVLCERCGYIQVDHNGKCISSFCKYHGEKKGQKMKLQMRELVIEKYKQILDLQNEYYSDYGHLEGKMESGKLISKFTPTKKHMVQPYPQFEKMEDEEILEIFVSLIAGAAQPRG